VPVLNINQLANSMKPAVLPGEAMEVTVVKTGTERQQGVAYLEDGTMVVVEDGQYYLNKRLKVIVTSALTNRGRPNDFCSSHNMLLMGITNEDSSSKNKKVNSGETQFEPYRKWR
jgi:hypothetical protein